MSCVTVPLPAPDLVTESAKDDCTKAAVTVVAAFIVTAHVPVPVQPPPLQPLKVEPAAGAAVKVTMVPLVKEDEQVVPHEMPAGELVTVPLPAPDLVTVSAKDDCTKAAVTVVSAFIVTVQVPVPVQPPPVQPVKVEPAAAAAVRVTCGAIGERGGARRAARDAGGTTGDRPAARARLGNRQRGAEAVDTPVPVTRRESVSPSAVKLTLPLAAVVLVGVNCTVTVAVAPVPTSVNGLPETMLNGADTEAVPVVVPLRVL